MKKKSKWRKRLAFVLVLCIVSNSTGIAEALVHSGLVQYLGCVGDNIVRYYNNHFAYAEDNEGTPTPTPQPTQAPVILSCNCSPSLYVTCPHKDLDNAIESVGNSVATVSGKVDGVTTTVGNVKETVDTLKSLLSKEGDTYKLIESIKGSDKDKKSLADLYRTLETIAASTNTTAARLLDVYDQLYFDGKSLAELQKDNTTILSKDINSVHAQLTYNSKSVAQLQAEDTELMNNLFSTWFSKDAAYASGNGYSMYKVADNISTTTVTLTNSLGYTDETGKDNIAPKYVWAQTETRTLAGDLYTLNNNFYETFGYYQYTPDEEGNIKDLSEWTPSIAKDFSILLSMYKNYRVAHVYSANAEIASRVSLNVDGNKPLWCPTPDELSYTKERVLNAGYANLYDGFWSVTAADVTLPTNHRYETILGHDILYSAENYTFEINEDEGSIAASFTSKKIDAGNFLNYSDMFRILYRALGQDIVTYTEAYVFDGSIKAETSPASVGLSNINELEGYNVYVATNRNNGLYYVDGEQYVEDKYLERAISDGFIGRMTYDEASTTYPTYAEVWYYASKMMKRYGEPEMNSTELHSLLQIYGSYYPIQEGTQVADAWAYLKARGVLVTNDNSYDCVDVNTFLDIAMRIKDKDSRITYKDIQLVVSLDQTVVDTGYFPVFGNRLEVVDGYSNKITYSYDVGSYDLLIECGNGTGEYFVENLLKGNEETESLPSGLRVKPYELVIEGTTHYYVHISVPYSFDETEGLVLKKRASEKDGQDTTICYIPNKFMTGGVLKYSDNMVTSCVSFNSMNNDDLITFVDNERSGKEVKFAFAEYASSFLERVGFFFEYVFAPVTAYAAEGEGTNGSGKDGSGGVWKSHEMSFNKEEDEYKLATLMTCEPIMKHKQRSYVYAMQDQKTFVEAITKGTANGVSLEDMKIMNTYGFDGMGESFYNSTYGASISLSAKSGGSESVQLWDVTNWMSTETRLRVGVKDLVRSSLRIIDAIPDRYGQYSLSNVKTVSDVDIEGDQKSIYNFTIDLLKYINAMGIRYTITQPQRGLYVVSTDSEWLYNTLTTTYNGASSRSDNTETNATPETMAQVAELMLNSGFEGAIMSVPESKQLYSDTIMSKRNDTFISYSALSEKGLTLSSKTPVPKDGVLSFYLKDIGQVIISTVNNSVSINAVYIDLGDTVPILQIDTGIYINYRCLVGSMANYVKGDTSVEEYPTTTGTGKTAKYQLVNTLTKVDAAKYEQRSYIGVEQFATDDLGNITGVHANILTEYNGYYPTSELLSLNGTFPLANWVITEVDSQAYVYVFYQRGMFDVTWNANEQATSCWLDEDCVQNVYRSPGSTEEPSKITKYNWKIDSDLKALWEAESGQLTRVKIGEETVYNKLKSTYGFSDEDSLNKYGLLRSTAFSLLSLAKETGVLIENRDYLVRRFEVTTVSDLTKIGTLEVGKVYNLPTIGYVYVLPKEYDHLKYASGDYVLPIVYSSNYLIDYNMNIYGRVDVKNSTTTDTHVSLPYGAIVVENWGDHGSVVTSVKWIIPGMEESIKSRINIPDGTEIKGYTPQLTGTGCLIAAPVGIYKHVSPVSNDYVWVKTLNKYTTSACSFYVGARRLSFKDSESAVKTFRFVGVNSQNASNVLSVDGEEKALVTTRDYYGRHHFVLSPNTVISGSISINVVDANQYAIDYSDNPIYAGIKAWISDLDSFSSMMLYILFYIMPMIMLAWIVILIGLALTSNRLVQGVGRMVGTDIVSIATLGRRTTQEWRGWRVVVPLFVAFVAMGLFYGPNLLRAIEIVTDFAYELAGLK